MDNEAIVKKWFEFAEMDFQTAQYLYAHMIPQPREIICYHCQQAIEKALKGLLIAYGKGIKKTHDLGLLAEMLQDYCEVPEEYIDLCDNLTPYGVRVRYPQDMEMEDYHVKEALHNAEKIFLWSKQVLKRMK